VACIAAQTKGNKRSAIVAQS
jgi:hypothetical protein